MTASRLQFRGQIQRPGQKPEDALFVLDQVKGNQILLRGESTTEESNHVVRAVTWIIEPGATPGTNINVSESANARDHYNIPTMTDGTNIAGSGSSGSYSLNAGGTILTVDLTERVIGVLSASIAIHDINSSSTSELYVPTVRTTSADDNLSIRLFKRGSQSESDIRTIMDAGDYVAVKVCFITDS